jgi:hypothetical protein
MSSHLGFRLSKGAIPMKLCLLCSKLNVDVLSKHGHDGGEDCLQHQPNFTALATSASTGCEMCSMFLESVTKMGCNALECSFKEARQRLKTGEDHDYYSACLIQTRWERGKISEVKYGIPVFGPQGEPVCYGMERLGPRSSGEAVGRGTKHLGPSDASWRSSMRRSYTTARFTLRSCRGDLSISDI